MSRTKYDLKKGRALKKRLGGLIAHADYQSFRLKRAEGHRKPVFPKVPRDKSFSNMLKRTGIHDS